MKLTRDLREFIELLNSHGVEYLLIGGWAFSFHATPRYTGDIDFFVRCDSENAKRLQRALTEFGFVDLPAFEESFLQPDRILQFGVPPNRIDILTQISGVDFSEAWQSRVSAKIDGLEVPVVSREVLIQNKKAAGRPKDLADADALQKTAPPKIS
jgi:hypothetical protein